MVNSNDAFPKTFKVCSFIPLRTGGWARGTMGLLGIRRWYSLSCITLTGEPLSRNIKIPVLPNLPFTIAETWSGSSTVSTEYLLNKGTRFGLVMPVCDTRGDCLSVSPKHL